MNQKRAFEHHNLRNEESECKNRIDTFRMNPISNIEIAMKDHKDELSAKRVA